jgi:hypothetical protein
MSVSTSDVGKRGVWGCLMGCIAEPLSASDAHVRMKHSFLIRLSPDLAPTHYEGCTV